MSIYDIIEQVEASGVKLEAYHGYSGAGWTIEATGLLTNQHAMMIVANRAEVIDLLGKRNLARCRMQTAIEMDLNTPAVRMSYYHQCKTDDHRRAFEAGWPETATEIDKEA